MRGILISRSNNREIRESKGTADQTPPAFNMLPVIAPAPSPCVSWSLSLTQMKKPWQCGYTHYTSRPICDLLSSGRAHKTGYFFYHKQHLISGSHDNKPVFPPGGISSILGWGPRLYFKTVQCCKSGGMPYVCRPPCVSIGGCSSSPPTIMDILSQWLTALVVAHVSAQPRLLLLISDWWDHPTYFLTPSATSDTTGFIATQVWFYTWYVHHISCVHTYRYVQVIYYHLVSSHWTRKGSEDQEAAGLPHGLGCCPCRWGAQCSDNCRDHCRRNGQLGFSTSSTASIHVREEVLPKLNCWQIQTATTYM